TPESSGGRRFRETLLRASRGPRPLARTRLDADAVRVASLRVHTCPCGGLRLARRRAAAARVRTTACRRVARDQLCRVRTGSCRRTRAGCARDPRWARAVPLRRLDACLDVAERSTTGGDDRKAEGGCERSATGGALRHPCTVHRCGNRALRRCAAP